VGPRGVYDEAKRFAEAMTMAYHRYHAVEVRIIRIFNTYGPRMRMEDGRVVPNLIVQALRGEPLTVYGDGSQTRSFCYVDDLVRGIILAAERGGTGPMNLGNPAEMTILQFAHAIKKLIPGALKIDFRDLPVDAPKVRRPDIAMAKRLLDWEPRVPLEEGLEKTIPYFRAKLGAAAEK
jgi:dTDP-glucose 4,6-dehydratase